ncbi:glutamine-hydrolyzing GMP synthase [Candidatus Micrarchaeota archaeon]|nr:glutamine-hydrolyzing GMP synthase [Candidatus Micrarchaeota archaeon]
MIIIIDNGSQYTHLIKRNCRDMGFESEIINNQEKYNNVKNKIENAEKIIISGGPSSVYAKENGLSEEVLNKIRGEEWDKPVLGICFGHQLIAYVFGGGVEKGKSAEYGISTIEVDHNGILLKDIPLKFEAWVSHFDEVKIVPEGFKILAHSEICRVEAMENNELKIYSVQFHPEVWHTQQGEKILENFLKV